MTGLVEYKGDTYVTKYHYKNGLKDGYGGLFSGYDEEEETKKETEAIQ